jgi:hsp70-interacting protein
LTIQPASQQDTHLKSIMSNTNGGGDPWAWLGLLKWSLSYADGTKDNSDISPMTDEDREFLEKVMKEGIIDENERMKVILAELSKAMEYYKSQALIIGSDEEKRKGEEPPLSDSNSNSDEALEELLQELRDIVEQIDYARAFCSLKGLPFLMGCATEITAVPESIRAACIGILSTLSQNNPPVQKELLELGAIKTLSDLFFLDASSVAIKAKIMQAISSMVRHNEIAETVFCSLAQAPTLIMSGLDPKSISAQQLKTRTLFFLRALLSSDTADSSRVSVFGDALDCIMADNYLSDATAPELREISIALLEHLLEQKKGVNRILQRKNSLAAQGVHRITSLRSLTDGEDREFAQVELEHWEAFMVLLARAKPESDEQETTKQDTPLIT